MRLRLYENHRFVRYAPFYATYAVGAYAAERAGRELLPSPGVGLAERALLDGAVDVLCAGPMRVMKHRDENPNSALVCFAEVVRRDPFSIVGQYPNPDFRLSDLAKMRLATVCEVPTPWLCLQADLRPAGIDPARLDRIADRRMAENLNALSEGRLEAAQFFEPVVEEALASGRVTCGTRRAHVAVPLARFRDTRDRFVRDAEPLLSMVRAIQRTQQWIYSRSAPEIAETISSFFPALDRGVLAAALASYQAQSVWGRDPVLPDGFDCLRRYLVSGGFIRGRRIRSLRRQSPRPASPDRIGFAYEPEARADRQSGIKGDSDLSTAKAIRDLSAARPLLRGQPGGARPTALLV